MPEPNMLFATSAKLQSNHVPVQLLEHPDLEILIVRVVQRWHRTPWKQVEIVLIVVILRKDGQERNSLFPLSIFSSGGRGSTTLLKPGWRDSLVGVVGHRCAGARGRGPRFDGA